MKRARIKTALLLTVLAGTVQAAQTEQPLSYAAAVKSAPSVPAQAARPARRSRAADKPVIYRLNELEVASLAPSAYLLQRGHMLSVPLYGRLQAAHGSLKLFAADIKDAAEAHQLPEALIAAIIMTESGFNPQAVSPAGAQGLMQLMPSTLIDLKVEDPFDSAANIAAGTAYFKAQLLSFGSLDLALAAYNAGPAAVRQYGGVPPYPETQQFVSKVKACFAQYAAAGLDAALPEG